ncbi:MAG: hypothetical protein DWG75_01285 [Chloroflexi bacterium]|nr:hypothetical protein [Chloroflexota bacterium]
MEAPQERRFRPPVTADCPIFSERLEEHLIAVSRGEAPSRGRFCGNCYHPLGRDIERCSHCNNHTVEGRPTVDLVPDEITEILRRQRKTESTIVTSFAFLGVLIAVVGGLGVVLGIPYLRDHLLPATIVYAIILLIGVRGLAGFLGGYYGDRIGYERARAKTIASWREFEATRDDIGG